MGTTILKATASNLQTPVLLNPDYATITTTKYTQSCLPLDWQATTTMSTTTTTMSKVGRRGGRHTHINVVLLSKLLFLKFDWDSTALHRKNRTHLTSTESTLQFLLLSIFDISELLSGMEDSNKMPMAELRNCFADLLEETNSNAWIIHLNTISISITSYKTILHVISVINSK